MLKRTMIGLCTAALAITLACSKAAVPTSPTSASGADGAAAADGSTLKIPAPTLTSPANGFTAVPGSTDPITLSLTNVTGTYATFPVTYEFEIKSPAGSVVSNPKVAAGSGSTSAVLAASSLTGDTSYTWRARATYETGVGPWSAVRTFRTAIPEGFFGQTVIDPLTNGKTYGKQKGGRFVSGGWQAMSMSDGIDYDIPTLVTGTVEFDVTNIGPQEGQCCAADLKLLSMGDANTFGSFGQFRDHPWKMHLVQRADNDGLEIIWRNGGNPEDYTDGSSQGDHRTKMPCCGPTFRSDYVNHFVLKWDPYGFTISASTNGGPLIEYMDGDFDGYWYEPDNHRISLGCYPRGETIQGIIYRNIKIRPGN
jgi:hypothetical protein